MRLIVTRPRAQAHTWVQALRAQGVDAQPLPLIEIVPLADAAALHDAWHALQAHDLAVFVSPSAVQAFFDARPDAAPWPDRLAAATVGSGSAAALRSFGVARVLTPPEAAGRFDSEALWEELRATAWRRVLLVRGDGGREWLAQRLREQGAVIDVVQAYRRAVPTLDAAEQGLLEAALAAPAQHCWHFSSAQAVAHLEQLAPGADWSAPLALATHARIAQRARQLGFARVRVIAPSVAAASEAVRSAASGSHNPGHAA